MTITVQCEGLHFDFTDVADWIVDGRTLSIRMARPSGPNQVIAIFCGNWAMRVIWKP